MSNSKVKTKVNTSYCFGLSRSGGLPTAPAVPVLRRNRKLINTITADTKEKMPVFAPVAYFFQFITFFLLTLFAFISRVSAS
jgi:hypothetical protein